MASALDEVLAAAVDWMIGITQPRRERLACLHLGRRDVVAYCPMIEELRARNGVLVKRTVPLFPGYLFVPASVRPRAVATAWGMRRLLLKPGGYAVLPAAEIAVMRQRELDSVVELPSATHWEPGDRVHVKSGLFEGANGIVEGMSAGHRVKVLLDYLGCALVPEGDLSESLEE